MFANKGVFNLSFAMVLLYSHISYAAGGTSPSIGKVIFKFFFYLIVFIIVIIFAIYGTKFIAKNSKRFVNSKYIHILDKISLDTNTKIVIVEISKCIYILGITSNTIKIIDKIAEEDFNFKEDLKFEEQLEWHKNKYTENRELFTGFRVKLNEFSSRWDKFISKEDENDEK